MQESSDSEPSTNIHVNTTLVEEWFRGQRCKNYELHCGTGDARDNNHNCIRVVIRLLDRDQEAFVPQLTRLIGTTVDDVFKVSRYTSSIEPMTHKSGALC